MGLTLQFIPYNEIEDLGSARRVKKLLDIAKEDKIIFLEGRLTKQEEADLIAITMEEIDQRFKGIELAVINPPSKEKAIIKRAKNTIINAVLGDRVGFTIIGPATVVKEIKKNPDKIELLTLEAKKKKKRK